MLTPPYHLDTNSCLDLSLAPGILQEHSVCVSKSVQEQTVPEDYRKHPVELR